MPSGKVHDQITMIAAIPLGLLAMDLTNSPEMTAIVVGSHLFAGFMFGPDLDIKSIQINRWGMFRFIWKPYQKMVGRHRSPLSHGAIIGTAIRLAYILFPLAVIAIFLGFDIPSINLTHAIAVFVGLEIGAASHYLADRFL
jgi:uncharacterized metal-binding protein